MVTKLNARTIYTKIVPKFSNVKSMKTLSLKEKLLNRGIYFRCNILVLRICLISVQYIGTITGGGGIHVVNLSKELAKMGNDVTVLSMGIKNLPESETITLDGARINIRRFFTQDSYKISNPYEGSKREEINRLHEFCEKVLAFVLKENFDIIHLHGHFMIPSIAKQLKEKKCSAKIITTFHAFESLIELTKEEYMTSKEIINFIVQKEREALTYSDAVIIASKHLLNELRKVHGDLMDKINVKIIPSGVSNDLIKYERNYQIIEEIRQKIGCDYILFNLNRIDPSKKIEYIINALPDVCRKLKKKIALLIAGKLEKRNIDYRNYLKKLASEIMKNHPDISIVIMENIPEAEKILLYDAADVFVMSSPTEPFGITILEALARGTPVVVTDAPGPREIFNIRDSFNTPFLVMKYGVLVNFQSPHKIDNLSAAIAYLLKNLEHFRRHSDEMIKFVKQSYSWTTVARKVLEVYKELLKEK